MNETLISELQIFCIMIKRNSICLVVLFAIAALNACSDDLSVYNISAVPNDPAFGSVTGAGEYEKGETVSLEAIANEDYQFIYWTEDGQVVHTEAQYTFTASKNRELVAFFAHGSQGYFSIQVTGDLEEALEGFAIFGQITNDATGQEVFALTFVTVDEVNNLVFVKGGDRPVTGSSVAINPLDFEDVNENMIFDDNHLVATFLKMAELLFFFSDDGMMEVNESTGDVFAGSFEMSASGFRFNQPLFDLYIEISGSFVAIEGDVDIPFVTSKDFH